MWDTQALNWDTPSQATELSTINFEKSRNANPAGVASNSGCVFERIANAGY